MLSGRFPFEGNSHAEIVEKIKKDSFAPMEGFAWEKISALAKDLVKKLLIKNCKKRITAADAMNHPWFQQFNSSPSNRTFNKKYYSNMQSYKNENLFKKEAL